MSRRWWLGAACILGAWTVIGLLDVAKAFTMASIRNEPAPLAYLLVGHMPQWYGWALLTPIVLYLCGRFPIIGSPLWVRSMMVHSTASLVLGTAHLSLTAAILHRVALHYSPSWFQPDMPLSRLVGQFFDTLFVVEILVYWGIVFVVSAWAYYDRARQKELLAEKLRTEAARLQLVAADARLEALRHELEPHFLFNTLNAVTGMIRGKRGDQAVQMLALLSELLRTTLGRNRPHEIALRDEVALLRRYLEIQQLRFGDRLSVRIVVDDDVLDAMVPPFILQPLVENAVRHGVERVAGRGEIEVGARRVDGHTELRVRNGSVPDAGTDSALVMNGIGLSNTRERLARLYGAMGTFALDLTANGGGVTTATVRLPFHTRPQPLAVAV